jgi:CheY-like chemotaxis protein
VSAETILLVDDDPAVRGVVASMLQRLGYRVLAADNGDLALARFHSAPGPVGAVVTDIAMPDMNGYALAATLRETDPALKVVFISGHAGEAEKVPGNAATRFLAKPFDMNALARTLRDVLGSAPLAA